MLRILHVEDNPGDIDLLRMQFMRLDSDITLVGETTVEQALETLDRDEFDCIVCDMQLPKKNGIEMLRAVRAAGVSIPFIFLTGQGNEELAAEALRLGASDYYSKDSDLFNVKQLINSIRKHVEGHQLRLEHEKMIRKSRITEQNYETLFASIEQPLLCITDDMTVERLNREAQLLLTKAGMHEVELPVSLDDLPFATSSTFLAALNHAFETAGTHSQRIDDLLPDQESEFNCKFVPIVNEKKVASVVVILTPPVIPAVEHPGKDNGLEQQLLKERQALQQVTEKFRGQLTDRIKFEKIFAVLHDLARSLTTIKNSRLFYEQVCKSLGKLINTENIYIAIHEHETIYSFPFIRDLYDDEHLKEADLAGSLTDYTFRLGEPQLIDENQHKELASRGLVDEVIGAASKVWMGVPLQADGQSFGVLAVQSYHDATAYSRDDLEILTVVSNQFALAVRKKIAEEQLMRYQMRLEERVRERTRDLQAVNLQMQREIELRSKSEQLLSALYKLSRTVLTSVSLNELLTAINDELAHLFSESELYIGRISNVTNKLEMLYFPDDEAAPMPVARQLIDRVMNKGQTIYLAHGDLDQMDDELKGLLEDDPNSWLAAPLITQEGVKGGIVLRKSDAEDMFTKAEYSMFTSISLNLAQAIEKKISDDERSMLLEYQQEKNQQLQNVNQELEAFAYSVSHDLRKPIRHIHGFSEVLQDIAENKGDEEILNFTSRIRTACDNMNTLVDDILQLSRINRIEIRREKVDVSSVSRSILHELEESNPERSVTIEVEDGLEVDAEPALTKVLMQNLLENAWKFTKNSDPAEIAVYSLSDNNRSFIAVKDNGAGFDESKSKEIFAPFVRLHKENEYEGTGIGLATVARIIHRHGGVIHTRSKPGNGTTFYFRF